MKKIALSLIIVISSASVFAANFTKPEYGCYKVTGIKFDEQSAQIAGQNVVKGKKGIISIISYGIGYDADEYNQNIEMAKFAMAHDFQLCMIKHSILYSVKK